VVGGIFATLVFTDALKIAQIKEKDTEDVVKRWLQGA